MFLRVSRENQRMTLTEFASPANAPTLQQRKTTTKSLEEVTPALSFRPHTFGLVDPRMEGSDNCCSGYSTQKTLHIVTKAFFWRPYLILSSPGLLSSSPVDTEEEESLSEGRIAVSRGTEGSTSMCCSVRFAFCGTSSLCSIMIWRRMLESSKPWTGRSYLWFFC